MPIQKTKQLTLKYWFNTNTRIGRIEFLFKIMSICILVLICTIFINYFIIAKLGESFLFVNFIFLALYWALIISAFKTRYNDLPRFKYGFIFFIYRCFFSKGDQFHNEYGNPSKPFSSKILLSTLLLYFIIATFFSKLI